MARPGCSWKSCLIGCLGVFVVMILISVSTGYWLVKKVEFEADSSVLMEDTDMYVRMYLKAEDTILVDFASSQASRINANNPGFSEMPGFIQEFQSGQTRRDIEKMLPMEVEIVGRNGFKQAGGAVGFSLYGGFAKLGWWFMKKSAGESGILAESNGVEYVVFPNENAGPDESDEICLSLKDNIFYFSGGQDLMESMLAQTPETALDVTTDSRFRGVDTTAPVYGFHQGRESMNVLKDILTDESNITVDLSFLDYVDRFAYHFSIRDQETMTGLLILDTQRMTRDMLDELEAAMKAISQDSDLNMDYKVSMADEGFRIALDITGFADAVVYE